MKNVWNIFKQDLRNIKRVPFIGLLLIALTILPALYAWFNLGSTWDPYANTKSIQIAVVNEDVGVEMEGELINIGEEIVENLKDNDDFGWQFLSKQEAEDEVELGNIYAAIYIEEAFSQDLVQVLDGEPKQAEVLYQVNEKINAIAPKMTSAGASAIVTGMNNQFIEETSKALFEQFDKLGIRMEEGLPTMRRLKHVIGELEERFPEINQFAERLIGVEEDWDEIDDSVEQFLAIGGYFPEIHQGANLIYDLEKKFPEINQLGAKMIKLEESIPEMEVAIKDISAIGNRFFEVTEQLEEAYEKTKGAEEIIGRMQEAIPALAEKKETAEEYIEALQTFIDEASESAVTIDEIIKQQLQFINKAAQMTNQVLAMLENEESLDEVTETITKINEQLTNQLNVIDQTIELYNLLDKDKQNEDVQATLRELVSLREDLSALQEVLVSLENELEQGSIDSNQFNSVRERTQRVEQASEHLAHSINWESGKTLTAAFTDLIERYGQSNNRLMDAYSDLDSLSDILAHADQIINTGGETIEKLLNDLPDVEAKVKGLIEKTEAELPKVITVIETLAAFVDEELPQIEDRVHAVANMMRKELPLIEERYYHVATILEEEVPKVKDSLSELNHFSREYLPEFEEVIHQTVNHFSEIEEEDKINDLINILRNDLDEESDFFASPIHLKEERLFEIPNYGSANAPFYTVLSIWVGALLLSNSITTNVHPIDMRKDYTIRHVYFGKLILFLIVGVLQGLVVSIGNLQLLGIYAKHPVLFVVFSIFISVVLMTIVYTLVSILGNIGKGLAIILLVLQLSSSGATFPIDVAPPFFQSIHAFMPFTYAINLLREAVGGMIPILVLKDMTILLLFMLLAFFVGIVLKPLLATRMQKTFEKSKESRMVD